MKKFKPFGICKDADQKIRTKADDFSDRLYDGVEIRSDRKQNPVVIMRCKRIDPLPWKVVYGFSQVYFRSFGEAVEVRFTAPQPQCEAICDAIREFTSGDVEPVYGNSVYRPESV